MLLAVFSYPISHNSPSGPSLPGSISAAELPILPPVPRSPELTYSISTTYWLPNVTSCYMASWLTNLKGGVQRDRSGQKWYPSIGLPLIERRPDFSAESIHPPGRKSSLKLTRQLVQELAILYSIANSKQNSTHAIFFTSFSSKQRSDKNF